MLTETPKENKINYNYILTTWRFDFPFFITLKEFIQNGINESQAMTICLKIYEKIRDDYQTVIDDLDFLQLFEEILHCLTLISEKYAFDILADIINNIQPLLDNKEYDFAFYILSITGNLISLQCKAEINFEPILDYAMNHLLYKKKIPRFYLLEFLMKSMASPIYYRDDIYESCIEKHLADITGSMIIPPFYIQFGLVLSRHFIKYSNLDKEYIINTLINKCIEKIENQSNDFIVETTFVDFLIFCLKKIHMQLSPETQHMLIAFILKCINEAIENSETLVYYALLHYGEEEKNELITRLICVMQEDKCKDDKRFNTLIAYMIMNASDQIDSLFPNIEDFFDALPNVIDIIEHVIARDSIDFARGFLNILETFSMERRVSLLESIEEIIGILNEISMLKNDNEEVNEIIEKLEAFVGDSTTD